MTLKTALETIANVNAGGFMGPVTAVDPATNTVSIDVGTGTPVAGVYVLADFATPAIGDYMICLIVGTYYVAIPRKTKSPVRVGTITALTANSTLSVDVGGGTTLASIPYLASYAPAVADKVFLAAWDATYVCLGKTGSSTVPTPPVVNPPEYPTVEYGETIASPFDGWAGTKNRANNAWSWVSSLGPSVGVEKEFLGSTVYERNGLVRYDLSQLPSGVSITAIKLVLTVGGGVLNSDMKVKTLIRPHSYTAPPAAGPSWDSRTITSTLTAKGFMDYTQYTVDLPSSWLTDLLAGTVKGLGFSPVSGADGWGNLLITSKIIVKWRRNL